MFNNKEQRNYSIKCSINSFISLYLSGVIHPLDLIKTRFQSHDGNARNKNIVPQYHGIWKGLKKIYQQQKLQGLYKGFHISMISQASAYSLFFFLYQYQKMKLIKKDVNEMKAICIASTQASFICAIATQPLWVIKTRMVLNIKSQISQLQNFIFSCRQIMKQDGLKGYSKGLGLSILLSFSGVVQMYGYEKIKKIYENWIPQSKFCQKGFVCGSISKIFVVLLTYPITTVRTRIQQPQYIQNNAFRKYNNVQQIILKMIKQEGIRGFFKGLNTNILRGILQKVFKGFYEVPTIKNQII